MAKNDTEPYNRDKEAASILGFIRATECDHLVWKDCGTLKSGDNPTIEIEACVQCGVQRKKQHDTG